MPELETIQNKPYRIHLIDEGGQGWIYNTLATSPEEALAEYRQRAGSATKRIDWIEDVQADKLLNQTAAETDDVDWRAELAEGTYEAEGEFDIAPENIGIWVNEGSPDIGYRIQQYAKRYGWNGDVIENAQEEEYYPATQAAQKFLTDKAPAGFFFGNDKDGNWGMWENVSSAEEAVSKGMSAVEQLVPGYETRGHSHPNKMKPSIEEQLEQEKDVMEMTDEDREKEIAQALEGEKHDEVQSEGTKTTAAIDPNKLQWSKEGSDAVSKDEAGNTVSKVPWVEFEQKSPEIAGKVTTASILEEVTILSEFCDDLHPLVANAVIDNGVKVFIKPLNRFGTVVRVLDDSAFRVEASDKIATYFREELEVRQTSE